MIPSPALPLSGEGKATGLNDLKDKRVSIDDEIPTHFVLF